MRSHFLPVISEVRDKIEQYRHTHPSWACSVASTSCPITVSLEVHHTAMHDGQLESITDDLWSTIRKGFRLQNQASFFEIVTVQLFVLFLASSNILILSAAIAMFSLPYVGSTYIEKEPVKFFKYGFFRVLNYRVSNDVLRILFVVALLLFSYFILSGL
jgi:hypothetical protein